MVINAERKGYDTILIEWDSDDICKLYKRDTEADEHRLLVETNAGIYIDTDRHIQKNNPLYYVELNGKKSKEIRADSLGDSYQYHIADNYIWQLKVLPRGFKALCYLKTDSSDYCPECYNKTLKKVTKTICNTCDGSGRMGAFKGPIEVYIAISSRKKEKLYDEMKEREEESIHAWTGNIPYLKQGDIIVFNGLLYTVHQIPSYMYSPSEVGNSAFLVRQEFIHPKR